MRDYAMSRQRQRKPRASARLARAVARRVRRRARCGAAAALPGLPRAGRRQRPVRRLLVEAVADRAALLRAARHPVRLRSRPGRAVDAGDRRPAGLSPGPRRGALRRGRAHAGACAEIWRPARSRADLGRWMARAGRELLADADALVPVPLHWRRLWARRFNQSALLAKAIARGQRRAGRRHRAQARQGDAAAGRAVAGRARQQCAGRVPRAARRQGRGRRPPPGAGRRRADLRRDRRRLRARAAAGRRPERRRAGVRAGCRRGAQRPYTSAAHRTPQFVPSCPGRNLHHALLPLLHRGQGAAEAQGRGLQRDRRVAATASCEQR